MNGLSCITKANAPSIVPMNVHVKSQDYGQIAEGNDFHRRERNEQVIDLQIARQAQRERNITEWKRRAAEAREAGDNEVADNIAAFLEAGHD